MARITSYKSRGKVEPETRSMIVTMSKAKPTNRRDGKDPLVSPKIREIRRLLFATKKSPDQIARDTKLRGIAPVLDEQELMEKGGVGRNSTGPYMTTQIGIVTGLTARRIRALMQQGTLPAKSQAYGKLHISFVSRDALIEFLEAKRPEGRRPKTE